MQNERCVFQNFTIHLRMYLYIFSYLWQSEIRIPACSPLPAVGFSGGSINAVLANAASGVPVLSGVNIIDALPEFVWTSASPVLLLLAQLSQAQQQPQPK